MDWLAEDRQPAGFPSGRAGSRRRMPVPYHATIPPVPSAILRALGAAERGKRPSTLNPEHPVLFLTARR